MSFGYTCIHYISVMKIKKKPEVGILYFIFGLQIRIEFKTFKYYFINNLGIYSFTIFYFKCIPFNNIKYNKYLYIFYYEGNY